MLQRVLKEIPKLTTAVVRAEVSGNSSYDVTKTGAADAVREAGNAAKQTTRKAGVDRQAHVAPGAQGAGRRAGRGPDQGRRRVRGGSRDQGLRQPHGRGDHRQADATSRRSISRRSTATSARTRTAPRSSSRITSLRGDEPWAGYDELTAAEVIAVLNEGDDDLAQKVRTYERAHKNRVSVLNAAERELANA